MRRAFEEWHGDRRHRRLAEKSAKVATNVKKDNGSRAIGTVLDPKGKAIAAISQGENSYGVVDILGKPYVTGYDPIRNKDNEIIGIYYVGYMNAQQGSTGSTN